MKLFAAASISLAMAIAAVPAAAQMSGSRAPAAGEAPAGGRLERLEQQITDLQGVVAAVETLAKSNAGGGSGYAAAAGGGASSEQIRQLSEQIADLTQRIERLEARFGRRRRRCRSCAPGSAPAEIWVMAPRQPAVSRTSSSFRHWERPRPRPIHPGSSRAQCGPASSRPGAKPCGSRRSGAGAFRPGLWRAQSPRIHGGRGLLPAVSR